MPRSMADPNYRYSPWTPERRKAASEAAKARWATKREAERVKREAEQRAIRPLTDLRDRINRKLNVKRAEMEHARLQYFAAKQTIEELEKARGHLFEAMSVLRKHLPADDLA